MDTSGDLMRDIAAIHVSRLTAGWVDGPEVSVVARAENLPVPRPAGVRGQFWRWKVFVVGHQPFRLIGPTVMHEAVAHFGVRRLFGGQRWRRFMLGVSRAGAHGGDVLLRQLRRRVREDYPRMRPALEADELVAALAEQMYDHRSGRLVALNPMRKQAEAIAAALVREHLRPDLPVTCSEVEGVLLLAEHRLRHGGLAWGAERWARAAYRWAAVTTITAGCLFWSLA